MIRVERDVKPTNDPHSDIELSPQQVQKRRKAETWERIQEDLKTALENAKIEAPPFFIKALKGIIAKWSPHLSPSPAQDALKAKQPRQKRTRRGVELPLETSFLVELLNTFHADPIARFARALPPEALELWLRFDPPDRRHHIVQFNNALRLPTSLVAFSFFAGGVVHLAKDEWAGVDNFCVAWMPGQGGLDFFDEQEQTLVLMTTIALAKSKAWLPRLRRCQLPQCQVWIADRSPTWQKNPARACSDLHRARLAKLRR